MGAKFDKCIHLASVSSAERGDDELAKGGRKSLLIHFHLIYEQRRHVECVDVRLWSLFVLDSTLDKNRSGLRVAPCGMLAKQMQFI